MLRLAPADERPGVQIDYAYAINLDLYQNNIDRAHGGGRFVWLALADERPGVQDSISSYSLV